MYIIVEAHTVQGLVEAVNERTKEGFSPIGGAFQTNRIDWFGQSMFRFERAPEPPRLSILAPEPSVVPAPEPPPLPETPESIKEAPAPAATRRRK